MRIYCTSNDEKKNCFKKVFQKNYKNYDNYNNYNENEYLLLNKKLFKKIFYNINSKLIYYKKYNEIINEFNIKVKIFFIIVLKSKFNCRRCDEKFLFNNKFYYYVKRYKIIFKSKTFRRFENKIIYSSTFNNFNFELDFKF